MPSFLTAFEPSLGLLKVRRHLSFESNNSTDRIIQEFEIFLMLLAIPKSVHQNFWCEKIVSGTYFDVL